MYKVRLVFFFHVCSEMGSGLENRTVYALPVAVAKELCTRFSGPHPDLWQSTS